MDQQQALAKLPELVGEGEVHTDGETAWFTANTGSDREAVEVEWSPEFVYGYSVWVRRWTPNHSLSSTITVGEYSADWEAASGVKGALLACHDRDARMAADLPMAEDGSIGMGNFEGQVVRVYPADLEPGGRFAGPEQRLDADELRARIEPSERQVMDWNEHNDHAGDGNDHDV